MKKLTFILIGLTFVFTIFINGSPFIFGDGYGYFHNGKTLVTEGDFLSNQKPEYYTYTGHAVSEVNGKYTTPYPPGSSILTWPFLSISKLFNDGTLLTSYYKAFDGHSLADGVAILIAASFYTTLAAILIYRLLKGLGFSSRVSFVSTFSVYIGGYVISYSEQFASYSHVYEVFAISAVLYSLYLFGQKFEYKHMFFAGLASGLLVLIRPVDIVIVIPIFLFSLFYRNKKANYSFIAGALPFAIIFFAYNLANYGNILATGYGDSDKLFDFSKFNLFNLLFSDVRGWFIYSPIMIFGAVGLFLYSRKNKPSLLIYFLPCVFLILIYSFWPNWWGGDSLGQRFLMVLIPFMAIGIANLLKLTREGLNFTHIFRPIILFVIIICTLYSASVAFLYRITPTTILFTENPDTAERYSEVTATERFTPSDILSYHLAAIQIDGFGTEQYISDIKKGFNGGRSLLLLALGETQPLAKLERISDAQFNLVTIPNNIGTGFLAPVTLGIQKKDKYIEFKFTQVNFGVFSKINVNCEKEPDCIVNTFYNSERIVQETKENVRPQVVYSDELKIDFASDWRIKLVDYKLK